MFTGFLSGSHFWLFIFVQLPKSIVACRPPPILSRWTRLHKLSISIRGDRNDHLGQGTSIEESQTASTNRLPRTRVWTGTSLLIRGNAATCSAINWCDAVGPIVKPRGYRYLRVLCVRNSTLHSATRSITIPLFLQQKDFVYSLTQLHFYVYCTSYTM